MIARVCCLQAGEQDNLEDEIIKHGVEDENIKKHETSGTCIDNYVTFSLNVLVGSMPVIL